MHQSHFKLNERQLKTNKKIIACANTNVCNKIDLHMLQKLAIKPEVFHMFAHTKKKLFKRSK